MCGVAIIVSDRRDVASNAMSRMVPALSHRGPDDAGTSRVNGCVLGHTRLSIIDPSGGQQPMTDDRGRYHLSFNGEIYNYRDIRRDLEACGNVFRTKSDTETLLIAYRQWGEQALRRLNGQFAFAVWDSIERRLFAARDRLGEKPLYYAVTPQGELLLASEIKALFASRLIEPTISRQAVNAYLHLNYVPPCMTVYENVQTLEPGQCLVWQSGKLELAKYWSPRLATIQATATDAALEVRRLLEKAVSRQTIADTPVGAFLSGGLDSTTIVALMTQCSTTRPKTFAAGFGDLIDELPFARVVAKKYKTDHAEQQIELNAAELVERMADVYDEPFGDSSNIPTYLISQFARREVKVVLSGDGGDELFGGYAWYQPLLRHQSTPTTARAYWAKKLQAKLLDRLVRVGLPCQSQRDFARRSYKEIRNKRMFPDLWDLHLVTLASLSPTAIRGEWSQAFDDASRTLRERYRPMSGIEGIDRAVDFDLQCYLPGDIFVKVDRAAMAHGLETRSPFMDVDLVEFVLSLPPEIRFEKDPPKSLLRRACEDLWPPVVRGRGKQGFGAPIGAWLQQPAMRALRNRVFSERSPLFEFEPAVASIANDSDRHPQLIWNLLCLGLWMERRTACLHRPLLAA